MVVGGILRYYLIVVLAIFCGEFLFWGFVRQHRVCLFSAANLWYG